MTPRILAGSTLPAVKGGLLALLAAALFGVSTPLVQHFGRGLGAFTTARSLYAGAAAVGAISRQRPQNEASLLRSDLPRLFLMAAFGAVIGPVALAWGLQHTSGTIASLMLTLEALFTAFLARLMYREMFFRGRSRCFRPFDGGPHHRPSNFSGHECRIGLRMEHCQRGPKKRSPPL